MKQQILLLIGLFVILGAPSLDLRAQNNLALQEIYGSNYREVLRKAEGSLDYLQKAEIEYARFKDLKNYISPRFRLKSLNDLYVGREENEPNNFFNTADNIDDVLALSGVLNNAEYNGRLVSGSFDAPDDIDVYEFTVDTTMMYYFAGLHGTAENGSSIGVGMRLFHESDLDTNVVANFLGIDGNEQIKGDLLGDDTDGRGGAGLFRLTGWSSFVDPATRQKLTGKYYLWVFNEDGDVGTYNITAYQIPRTDWVDVAEPNYPYSNLLINSGNPDVYLPTDGVARSYMLYAPDTVKYQHSESELPTQSNGTYANLLSQGDEDIDLFFIEYKANHTLVVETLPYFGWYRENDGSERAGSTRLSDPRIRIYDGAFTDIIAEDDDGGQVQMDGPNNIHSRIVLNSEQLGAAGVTTDGPLVLWMGAWASKTRSADQSVNSSDPGRMMYKLYAYQYSNDPVEVEPNNSESTATVIAARADTVVTGSFSSGTDVDMYRVFLHEHKMYTLFSGNSSTSSNIDIKIYSETASGPNNTISMSGDLVSGNSLNVKRDGNDFKIEGFVPEETGAYIIEVSSSAGNYQLGVVDKGEIYGGRIQHEGDNDLAEAAEADVLITGAGAPSVTAMIYPANDVDLWRFNATAGEEVNISVRGTNADLVSDFASKLSLLNDAGTEVATSTNGVISLNPTENGTYYVQVEASSAGEVGFYVISGGEPFEEKEPNNTAANATAFAIGELYEASLSSGDTDYWKATLEEGTLYSFRGVDNETGGALTVEFLDAPNGTNLLDDSGWPDNYSGNFKIANIMPTETKTYYIKISGGAGPYKLLSRANPLFGELRTKHEPDNSFAEADAQGTLIADGVDRMYVQYAADSARFFGDLDYFRIETVAGQKLVIEAKPVAGNTSSSNDPDLWNRDTDTRLRLFDATGTEVASDDDGGNDWYSKIEAVVPSTGVYYVQVANSRGPGSGDDRSMRRGDYILNVAASFEETESNNTIADAANNPLADNSFVEAVFTDATDIDVVKLSLVAGRIYHIRTTKDWDDAIIAELTAAGSSTNFLADGSSFNTRYSGSNIKINFIPETTGEYYLKLTPPEGAVELAYNLYMKSTDINAYKDVNEPNNSIADAAVNSMPPSDGTFISYMLYDESVDGFYDDLDYYGVTAQAGDTLIGETAPFSGDLWPRDFDGYMYLYDANGNELATNDDGGFDWHSKIEFEVPTDGTYYFLVLGEDTHIAPRNGDSNRIRDPARGEYKFALTRRNGNIITHNEEERTVEYTFKLDQNYPNPFNPTTNIQFQIANASNVTLEVFNVLGKKVATLVNERRIAGAYTVRFDARGLSSGMYFYRLQASDQVQIQKMLLIK